MPEKAKRLKRLRASWALRKKSTELRIATIATKLSKLKADEERLAKSLDGDMGHLSLFPDLATRRLLAIANDQVELGKDMNAERLIHHNDSLNLRRCEIFHDKHRFQLQKREEAVALEAIVDVFLLKKI